MKFKNEGQALFEFLIFTPLFLGLMALMISISASLNGGINQQKAVRGYYYNILKGNSNIESSFDLRTMGTIKMVGFFALGYQEKNVGENPFATCYRLHMFGEKKAETCDNADTASGATEFIRVMNMYGLCGASYYAETSGFRSEFTDASCRVKTD